MPDDLSFVTTEQLLDELDKRSQALFLVYEPINDPGAVIDHSHGSYTWILGALTVFQYGIAQDLVQRRGETSSPDDQAEDTP